MWERLLRSLTQSREQFEADDERLESGSVNGCASLAQVADRERVSATGVLRSVTLRPRDGVPAVEAELYDGSGSLDLIWLGRRQIAGIEPGRRLTIDGRVCRHRGRQVVFNPAYQLRPRHE